MYWNCTQQILGLVLGLKLQDETVADELGVSCYSKPDMDNFVSYFSLASSESNLPGYRTPRIFLWWSSLDCVSGPQCCVLLLSSSFGTAFAKAARRGHRTVCFLQAFGVTTGNSHDTTALSCSTGASTCGNCPPGEALWKLCGLKKM